MATSKNILILLLLGAVVTVGIIARQQHARLLALQTEINLTAEKTAGLEKRRRAAEVRAAELERDFTAALHQASATAELPPVEPTGDARPDRTNLTVRMNRLMEDPKFRDAMNLAEKARLNQRYAELFRQLNLTPEQMDVLKQLLVEKQNIARDVLTAALEEGMSPTGNRADLQKLIQEGQAEIDAAIKTAIGDTAFDQYAAYDKTSAQRQVIGNINASLHQPLSETKQTQLIDLLAHADSGGEINGEVPGATPGGGSQLAITDTVIEQARRFLDQKELDALIELQKAQAASRQVFQTLSGAAEK